LSLETLCRILDVKYIISFLLYDLRFSRRWLWTMTSSGMWCRVDLVYRLHLQGRKIRERGTSLIRWLQTKPPVENTQLYKDRKGGRVGYMENQ
jgi:hypothetical protein